MKKKSSISLGPGAASLILIFVVLSLAVLAMLSLMTARSDLNLSDRGVRVAEAVYALNEQAEIRRAGLDALLARCGEDAGDDDAYLEAVEAALPEEVALEGRTLVWRETDGARTLSCALEIAPLGSAPRAVWTKHSLTSEIAGAETETAVFEEEE